MKRFPKLPEAERIFLFLCLLTALVSIPYFIPGRCMTGDDFDFHISRLKGMPASLKAGYFPPKIYLDWMYDYGAGVGFYYPDTFLLVPAVMQLLGFSLITSYKAFCVLISFFTGLTAFLCATHISKGNQKIGFAAAILYVFAPYRLICLIYRCAIGEALGFIFLPLVIWGLYEIFTGHPQKWFLFALGFLGLLGSHLISLAIAGILTAIFFLLKTRIIVQRKSILSAILKAAIVTILLGAFFLLPFAEQTVKNDLYFNHQVLLEENRGIVPQNLHKFSNLFIVFDKWDFEEDRVKPYPGLLLLLIPLFRVLFIHRKNTAINLADRLTLSGFALLIISTEIFPWELIGKTLLLRIQYSWRLLQPATIFLCLSSSIYLYELNLKKSRIIIGIASVLCLAFSTPILIETIQHRTVEDNSIHPEFQELNAYEYTPVGATWKYADEHRNNTVCEDPSAEISNQKKSGLSYRFSYRLDQEKDVRFSLPYMFYATYAGTLTTPDGREIPLSFYQDENGLLAFRNNGIPEGNVTVHYEKTIIQKTGEIISLCTLLALCLMMRQADNSGHKHVLPGNTTSSARRLTVRLSPRGRRPFDVKEARHCRE